MSTQPPEFPPAPPPPPFPAEASAEGPPSSVLSICSLIAGVLSVLLCWSWFGLLGVPALAMGITSKLLARRGRASGEGLAIAGLVLGAVGLVLTVLFLCVVYGNRDN
ncbi:MAG: DUF4190 domain-containing protein [Terriglobales bacterium]